MKAVLFFTNDEIPTNSNLDDIFDIFGNVYTFYSHVLRNSIKELIDIKLIRREHPLYYNYLICNGTKLMELLEQFQKLSLVEEKVCTRHLEQFKKLCFYAGKGINDRMFSHLINGKKIHQKLLKIKKVSAKYSKITQIWENGEGVVIIRLFAENNHYEALSREYSLIKALKLNYLTNEISGSCYGAMKDSWNETEVINFGNMMLLNTLKMAVKEQPQILMEHDVMLPNGRNKRESWELDGILECFLDL